MNSVAIQGTHGSYSEEAAILFLGASANIQGFASFFETFQALLLHNVDYAVIPVKNSIAGEISSAIEIYNQTDLRVVDKFSLEINHFLIGTKQSSPENIKTITSHVEAIKQCQGFFNANPEIKPIIGSDTASCVRRITIDNDDGNAAIGSRRAAEIYGGNILCDKIADTQNNQTIFYLIENNTEQKKC